MCLRVALSPSVSCLVWESDAAESSSCLVVVHGLGDHAEYQPKIVAARPSASACVALDLPGHGHSQGRRGHVDDWETYDEAVDLAVAYARQRFGDKIVVWGSSLGGLLALWAGVRHQVPVVASAPMLRLPVGPVTRRVIGAGAWLSPTISIVLNPAARPPNHGVCTLGWLDRAAQACERFRQVDHFLGPVLIQVCTRDPLVGLADVEEVRARAQPVDVKVYDGNSHEPFLPSTPKRVHEVYIRDLGEFLGQHL